MYYIYKKIYLVSGRLQGGKGFFNKLSNPSTKVHLIENAKMLRKASRLVAYADS